VTKVLIADDSRTTQMLVMRALRHLPDVEFLSAENGVQALALLGKHAVDLLVTDVNMPEMDGIELVREVRRGYDKSALPILIITAKAEASARDEGLVLGANAYVLKPLSGQELLQQVKLLLSSAGGDGRVPTLGPPGAAPAGTP
jgi:two-component system chemotaxis response regulator CheY